MELCYAPEEPSTAAGGKAPSTDTLPLKNYLLLLHCMGNFWNATHAQSFVLISLLLIAQESWSHSNFIVQGLTWLPKVTGNQRQSYIIAFLCYSLRHIIDFYPFSWLCCEWQFELRVTVEEQGALLTCQERWPCSKGEAGQDMHGGALLEERPPASCKLQTAPEPLW